MSIKKVHKTALFVRVNGTWRFEDFILAGPHGTVNPVFGEAIRRIVEENGSGTAMTLELEDVKDEN